MSHYQQLPPDEPASTLTERRGGTLVRLVLCVGLAVAALGLAAQLVG